MTDKVLCEIQRTKELSVTTFTVQIYIAGDVADARRFCRMFCARGLCVTVEAVDYIYTGGAEAGVRIGLLNYPRFAASPEFILDTAKELANELRAALCQSSWLIVTPTETIWNTTRV